MPVSVFSPWGHPSPTPQEDKVVSTPKGYAGILNRNHATKSAICKSIECHFDPNDGIGTLFKHHDRHIASMRDRTIADYKTLSVASPNLLDLKYAIAKKMMDSCNLCERNCAVNRNRGELGFCGVGKEPRISSMFMHFGEEPELVPSGTIFFSGCNFNCAYCQNWEISQYPDSGRIYAPEEVAEWIRAVMETGTRNVNFVGGEPTPDLAFVIDVLRHCEANIPVIWNSNMYMSMDAMRVLDGMVDVFLVDFKYGNDDCAAALSHVWNYTDIIARNVRIANESAELLLRHLVLPNHMECCSKPILQWTRANLDPNTRVNLMNQYAPLYHAGQHHEIARRVSRREYDEAVSFAKGLGLNNLVV